MLRKVPRLDKIRLQTYLAQGDFDRTIRSIQTLQKRKYDVAALPFFLLDQMISNDQMDDIQNLGTLASELPADQLQLFQAILHSIAQKNTEHLDEITGDNSAHTRSRTESMGWSVFLKNRAQAPRVGNTNSAIFQFWDTKELPREIQTATDHWRAVTDQYTLYNAQTAAEYIAEHFGTNAANDFQNLWHPALQSDIFRLYRLAQDGGVYCDADSQPQQNISEFLASNGGEIWASSATNVPNCCVINGLVAAPAGHETILTMLDRALRTLRENTHKNIFWIAGPAAWTWHVHSTSANIKLLPAHCLKATIFKQINAPYKQTAQNWRVYEHGLGLSDETVQQALFNV